MTGRPELEAVAIVGLACRFPGAPNVQAYWDLVRSGREAIRRFTADELRSAGVSREVLEDPLYVPARGMLEDVDRFDADFFHLSPRDAGLLDSALAQPSVTFGARDLYPTVFEKAAALGTSLVLNHPFVDGNKRVGFAAMAVYLLRSGYGIVCTPDEGEATVLALAAHEIDRADVCAWIAEHAVEIGE